MTFPSKKLGEICEFFSDGDWIERKDQSDSGIRLVQTGNIGVGVFKEKGEKARYVSQTTFKKLNCTEVFPGDVLISRLPDPVGRACQLPDIGERMITAVDCAIARFNSELMMPEFFVYFSQNNEYLEVVSNGSTGTTRKRISRKNLGEVLVPTPPLFEQKRIVKILDEVFENIEKAKENTEKNLRNSQELFESYLNEVCKKSEQEWSQKKLGEVCNFVRGPFGGSLKKSIFKKEGSAVYEQQHAINNQFDVVRYFIDEKKFNEMKRFELKPGDLIMSCSGTMGKLAIVPKGVKRGIINQALLKLTPSEDLYVVFLKYWMQSKSFQESLKAYSHGSAIKNVASVKILKEIRLPVPSIVEQRIIVSRLDSLASETRKLGELYKKKLADLEELKKSVLRKAFSGEL